MNTARHYSWNGRPVTAAEYAERMSELLASGRCVHAENCERTTRDLPPGGGATSGGAE